uniref:Serine proteinase n=1 Tax=Hadrurus spadix TaxID=141984 RepID=A0A1W7R9J4_9SCOR
MNALANICSVKIFLLWAVTSSVQGDDLSRIYEGEETEIINFPWAIRVIAIDEDSVSVCTGSLVTKRYVLTAGHCVYNNISDSLFSLDDMFGQIGSSDAAEGRVIKFSHICLHPGYNSTEKINDIAILRTTEPVKWKLFSPASTICLASSEYSIKENENLTSIEWDMSDSFLRKTISKYIPNGECLERLMELIPEEMKNESYQEEIPEIFVCLDNEDGHQVCEGDSGGPIMTNRGFLFLQEYVLVASS